MRVTAYRAFLMESGYTALLFQCKNSEIIVKILEATRLGLNKDTIKYLEKQAQKKASELAHEAQQRLTDGYVSFIDSSFNRS